MNEDTIHQMNDVLEIANEIIEEDIDYKNKTQYPTTAQYNGNGDLEADYIIARDTLKSLISSGEFALTKMEKVLKDSDSARNFEVFSSLIKSISDLTTSLIKLQKEMKSIATPINIDKNIPGASNKVEMTTDQLKELINKAAE